MNLIVIVPVVCGRLVYANCLFKVRNSRGKVSKCGLGVLLGLVRSDFLGVAATSSPAIVSTTAGVTTASTILCVLTTTIYFCSILVELKCYVLAILRGNICG